VEDLARAEDLGASAVVEALDRAEAHAATVLAYACLAAGLPLDAATVRALLPELDEVDGHEAVGPFARAATGGDAVEVLLGMLDDGRASQERQALALLLIAGWTKGTPAPRRALMHARKLCRLDIGPEAAIMLGSAAARFGDDALSTLAAADIKAAARSKRAMEETIEAASRAPLDLLKATAAPRVAAGYTVKKEASVGRNDACPCGSGKKYKKCCALTAERSLATAPRMDLEKLDPEQVSLLRRSDLLVLDRTQLKPAAWVAAFRRATALRDFDLVEEMLVEAAPRERPEAMADLRMIALYEAQRAGAADVARRLHAALPANDQQYEAFSMACLDRAPDLVDRLEAAAESALQHEDDGAEALELAYAALRFYPALGILLARGAMHEGRPADCRTLLDEMEDARDRVLLPSVEPWWDFYDAMIDAADDRDEEIARTAAQAKLAQELRSARKEKRRVAAELMKMRERLEELDARAAGPQSAAPASSVAASSASPGSSPGSASSVSSASPALSAELEEERRRLRGKVAELRRIVSEGQEERRELRRQLSESEAGDDDDASGTEPAHAGRRGSPGRAAPAEDDDAVSFDGAEVDAPRAALVPVYSDRAGKALRDLDHANADAVLTLVASLAAGRPNAWSGTKHLVKVRGVLSARAGLYHRILFRVDHGVLEVLEVLARKDLEQVVAKLFDRAR